MNPNRMVLDLSHHNVVDDWDAMVNAGIVGIVHKATEGSSFVDSKYAGRRSGAIESGLCWGAYHFGNASRVEVQVEHFLRHAAPGSFDLICLDWEPNGDNTMSREQAMAWIELVERRLNRPGEVVIYSGNLAKEQLGDERDEFFGARRLWLAQYSSAPTVQISWERWWLWQYSDGQHGPEPHGCPGVSGDVDTNAFDGSIDALRYEWAGGARLEPDDDAPGVHIVVSLTGIPVDRVTVEIVGDES